MRFLITGKIELYQWVEADSEEEALDQSKNGQWFQTINQPIQSVQIHSVEIEATGETKEP